MRPGNHGPLADAEQEFIKFAPVGFLRILLGHTNKKGERPVVRWNNATVSSRAENHMFVDAENEDAWKIVGQEGPHTHFKFNFTTGGPVSDARWRKIARAL